MNRADFDVFSVEEPPNQNTVESLNSHSPPLENQGFKAKLHS